MTVLAKKTEWTTENYLPNERANVWRSALDQHFLSWSLEELAQEEDFYARITAQEISWAKVVRCFCDPCSGVRLKSHVSRDASAVFAVLHVLEGREVITQGEHETMLIPGDTLIWDSTRPMSFSVKEKLHKLTVFVPHKQLLEFLPQAQSLCGRSISGQTPLGKILGSNLRAVGDHCHELSMSEFFPVLRGVLSIIGTAFADSAGGTMTRPHRTLLQQIKDYIVANINDPMLNADSIASANHISKRYLYRLFEEAGCTLGDLIRNHRLSMCRDAIASNVRGVTLTEVAMNHGFNDMAHFSKLFKQAYGVPPSVFRDNARLPQLSAAARGADSALL